MSQSNLAERRAQSLATMPPKQRVAAMLKQNKNAITQVLPRHVSPERLMQVAFSAVRTTPKLLECKSDSLIGGIIQCAQLGLEPNTVLGHCYLIPFKQDVQIVIGYKGLIDLARRSGQIVSIAAHVVHENDDFEYAYGLEQKLRHVPYDGEDRGLITHAYAVAHLKDGGNAFEVMTIGDINRVMMQTQSKGKYGPWLDHFAEMARKTAIRRLAKYLPLSIEFASAVALDAKASGEEDQHLDEVLTGEYEIVPDDGGEPETSQTEALKNRLRSGDDRPITTPPESKQQETENPAPPAGAPVDVNGEVFNPKLHLLDDNDEPVTNQDGSFRKRPQRKAAEQQADGEQPPTADENGGLI